MTERGEQMNALTRPRSARPLWLVASLLFLLAAWQRPDKRAVFLAVGVVFGILAARGRSDAHTAVKPQTPNT
jgi:hypothetical protein